MGTTLPSDVNGKVWFRGQETGDRSTGDGRKQTPRKRTRLSPGSCPPFPVVRLLKRRGGVHTPAHAPSLCCAVYLYPIDGAVTAPPVVARRCACRRRCSDASSAVNASPLTTRIVCTRSSANTT